jgi:predicted RNase H-like HicB family nuclease
MRTLKVIVSKANSGVSAHLPEIPGYVIARDSVAKLKRDLREGIQFHIEGLYDEERQSWMMSMILSMCITKYVSGVKSPTPKTLERIEAGLKEYADELHSVSFDYAFD